MDSTSIVDLTTPNTPDKKAIYNHAFKFALIGLFLNIIVTIINQFVNDTELENGKIISLIIGLLSIAISTMIMQSLLKSYRAQFLDGWMSFKQSFNLGFKYTLILSVFVTLFSVIYFNFVIDYDVVMSEQLDKVIADLKKQNMNDEQIAKTIEISKKFMTLNSIIIIGFFSNVIIQTIINLILSAILKKEIKHD
jgi:hypothetical protein